MAQAVITITDAEDGQINISMVFEPSMGKLVSSQAQLAALRFLDVMKREATERSVDSHGENHA